MIIDDTRVKNSGGEDSFESLKLQFPYLKYLKRAIRIHFFPFRICHAEECVCILQDSFNFFSFFFGYFSNVSYINTENESFLVFSSKYGKSSNLTVS